MQQTVEEHPKSVLGSVIGAAAGGGIAALAHGGPGWIVAGAALGGLTGGFIGNSLDDRDRRLAAVAAQQALEDNRTGQAATWRNPDSGHGGTIVPTRTYQAAGGQYCREFQQSVTIDGKRQDAYGTACRQPDGSWRIRS